jgi:hypothetical protein
MPLIPRIFSLWRNLIHKDRVERELTEEIHAYRDLLIEEKIKEGHEPSEARRIGSLELGGVEQVKESVRDVRLGRCPYQKLHPACKSLKLAVSAANLSLP